MPNEAPDLGTIAAEVLSAQVNELELNSRDLPLEVHNAVADAVSPIKDTIDVGRLYESQRADILKDADLRPAAGTQRLLREAKARAEAIATQADRDGERAIEVLRERLTDAAQPTMDWSRESLARQELLIAFEGAKGAGAESVARKIAMYGSREAAAALITPFGRTLLAARGVKNLDSIFREVRDLNVAAAPGRAATNRELIAAKALTGLAGLGAAKGAAGSYVLSLLGRG